MKLRMYTSASARICARRKRKERLDIMPGGVMQSISRSQSILKSEDSILHHIGSLLQMALLWGLCQSPQPVEACILLGRLDKFDRKIW